MGSASYHSSNHMIRETSPGQRDESVLQQATAECRVLSTNDKDFAALAFL